MQEYIDAFINGIDGLAAMYHRQVTRQTHGMVQHDPTRSNTRILFYGMRMDSPSFRAFSSRSNLAERL